MRKFSVLATIICVPFLAGACQSTPQVTEPCDVLVAIPDAPPAVNRILVDRARSTAIGLARHKSRVAHYGCQS